MRKIILTICLLFITSYSIPSQWKYQTSGTTNNLTSVYFNSRMHGWVVGSSGTVLFTTNTGRVWNSKSINTTKTLHCIRFINMQTGWIVGDSGTCFQTLDGGSQWNLRNIGTVQNLRTIFFLNSQTGWITGDSGTIFNSTNSGVNWLLQTIPSKPPIYTIFFINPDIGWLGGRGVYKTTNGGLYWDSIITTGLRRSIFFVNEMTGWAAGGSYYFCKTTDGGESWRSKSSGEIQEIEDSPPATNTCVFFINENTGWRTSSHVFGGHISKTTDAANWNVEFTTPHNTGLSCVYFIDSTNGWAVGSKGIILRISGNTVTNIQENNTSPSGFRLFQNYPNPFNPVTNIQFQIPKSGYVSLKVYDILGNVVQELIEEKLEAGFYETEFNAENISSGVYFYRLVTNNYTDVKKMTVIK